MKELPMLIDLLIGFVWIAIVIIPVVVAYLQPVVSHNGYLDNYMNSEGQADTSNTPSTKA
jgi:hypothetical protein